MDTGRESKPVELPVPVVAPAEETPAETPATPEPGRVPA